MWKSCDKCQQAKPGNSTPGLLKPLQVPSRSWSEISTDFVTGLPETRGGFDAIMVVVCRLSKIAYFIPVRADWSTSQVAQAFICEVYTVYGTL